MIPAIIISCITFISITVSILFFPHIKVKNFIFDTYWLIALLGASLLIIFNLVPIQEIWNQMTSDNGINPIKILILFFSMTVISIYLDELGLFRYLANIVTKKAKDNQYFLFFVLYILTAVLTVFTSNDIVILTLTPFICFFCKNTKINPLPYLIGEFAAANTWSMMLIIGNPTNIYLATSAGIDFMDYLKVMWLPTLLTGLIQMVLIFLIFHNKLKEKFTIIEDDFHIESKIDLAVGLTALGACLIFLVISSYINVEMWLISFICAASLLIITTIIRLTTKKHYEYLTGSIKRLPYQLVPFVLSMFVIVITLNYQGITGKIGEWMHNLNTIFSYGLLSFVSSNIINNIPTSILFSNLTSGLTLIDSQRAVFASVIGTNIGAFFTPIGALAGIMFSGLLSKHNVRFTFLDFTKYGVLIALPSLLFALLFLFIVL